MRTWTSDWLLLFLLIREGRSFSVLPYPSSGSRIASRFVNLDPLYFSLLKSSNNDDNDDDHKNDTENDPIDLESSKDSSLTTPDEDSSFTRRRKIRKRVSALAQNIVLKPISKSYQMSQNIADLLREATVSAVDVAVDEAMKRRQMDGSLGSSNISFKRDNNQDNGNIDITSIIEDSFAPMEESLQELEDSLKKARGSLNLAKAQAQDAMEVIQAAAIAQAEAAVSAVAQAEEVAGRKALVDFYASTNTDFDQNAETLTLEDIDFTTSEMAPPFLGDDQCLVSNEPVVRVEKAPENSRRIFAGVDIMAPADTVWKVLTDYSNLDKVVPNLLVNDVLDRYDGKPLEQVKVDTSLPDAQQCQDMANQMKGAKLRQVGGAKVAGINFSARTTLEVREWPQGLPDFAHFYDEMWDGKSRKERAKDYTTVKLDRYRFPRPFAMSKLPTRDITMQSVASDDGEFRMYQGVWRMQPLPGCAPPGKDAMRLTYAVEVSPRAYLPVQLIEGRIVKDLCNNLNAIRVYTEALTEA